MKIFKFLSLLCALLYSFSFNFWCVTPDVFYWYNISDFYESDFMQPYSLVLLYLIKFFTGNNILLYRAIGWIISILSILIPYCFLNNRKQIICNIHFLAVTIVLFGPGTVQIFNPDVFTLLLMAILATFLIKTELKSNSNIIFASLLCSVSVFFRYPNILSIICVIVYLLLRDAFKKSGIQNALISVGSFILFYIILFYITYHNINIVSYTAQRLLLAQEEVGPSHGILNLLHVYWDTFRRDFSIFAGVVLLSSLGIKIFYNKVVEKKFILKWGLLLIICLFIYAYIRQIWLLYHWMIVYSFIIISLLLLWCYSAEYNVSIKLLTLLSIGMVCTAGTDMGLLKIFPFFAAFMPLCLIRYQKYLSLKKPYFLFLLLSMVFSCQIFYSQFNQCTNSPSIISNTFILKKDVNIYQNALRDYRKIGSKNNMIYYGVYNGHLMYAVTECKPLYRPSFWMFDDNEKEIAIISDIIRTNKKCVVMDFTKSQLLAEKLNNYRYNETEFYNIYKYKH